MFKKIRNYVKQHDQYGHKFSLNVGTTNNETNSFIGGAISLSMRCLFWYLIVENTVRMIYHDGDSILEN